MAQPAGSKDPSPSSRPATDSAAGKTAAGTAGLTAENLRRIGKYEIQKKIGAGGMGAVFLALDTTLNRTVALKVLPRDKASNPTLVKRFKAEAQSAANLRHDNIVMVYEAGEADGYLYIALEYVEGTDVANLVQKRGMMPVGRTIEVIGQVALALQHAYEQGIVHRDIKPGNILLRKDGVAKLADLGLARAVDDTLDTSITRAGTTVGTVDYMAPEQARDSKAADVRSDLYSLGCTWYFMLTGAAPYPEGSLRDKLRAHALTPLPDPRSLNPAVGEALIAVMRRMTEKDATQRYQTPAELIADLETATHASQMVSDAILGESDSDASKTTRGKLAKKRVRDDGAVDSETDDRPRKRSAAAAPPTAEISSAGFKSPRGEKPKRQPSELKRAFAFYAVIFLIVGGTLSSLAWIAMQYGSTIDGPTQGAGGNPFVNAHPEGGAGPGAIGQGQGVAGDGQSPDQGPGAAQGGSGPSVAGQPGTGSPKIGQPSAGGANPSNSPDSRTVRIGSGSDPSARQTGSGPAAETPGSRTVGTGTGAAGSPSAQGAGGQGTKTIGGAGAKSAGAAAGEARRTKEDALLPPWSRQSSGATGLVGTPGSAGTAANTGHSALSKLTKMIVRRGTSESGKFSSLNVALAQIPSEGAIIVLEGGGPFPLTPVTVSDRSRVIIRGDESSRSGEGPLVVFTPPPEHTASCLLAFINTDVEIDRVHFGLAGSGLSINPGDALLQVHGGDLALRNCSMTVTGITSALAAIKLTSPPDRKSPEPQHALIDQSVIRGDLLSAVLVEAPQVDLVIRSSLLWSGAAPALRLVGAATTGKEQRNLRLVSTTVCSTRAAVCVAGDAAKPIPAAFEWINSLVAAPPGGADPALCLLEGWSAPQQDAAIGKVLTWKSVASHYRGWKSLLRRDPGESPVTGPTQWSQIWKDRGAAVAGQVHETPWPERSIPDIVRAPLDLFAPESIGKQMVKTADGGWPGCAPTALAVASIATLEAGQRALQRPILPPGLINGPVAAEVIQVDLNKQDLGKVLAGRKLTNGTQIIASGFGPRQSSPIVIQNAWVRLRFEQADGQPLVITPKGGESARTADAASRPNSFIVVVNGGLEISGGAFMLSGSEKGAPPRWFIQATDSDLALVRCRIQGPLLGSNLNLGLIQWVESNRQVPPRTFSAPLAGYAVLDRCFLVGAGKLIEADLRQRALFIRNSVLVARDDLLDIRLAGDDGKIAGAIDLETSTFSATGSFFKVAASPGESTATAPLAVFADRCVFAPPLRSVQQKVSPTLLSYRGPLLSGKQMTWWEDHCAYTLDIATYLRDEAAPAVPQDFINVWQAQWGATHVLDALTGPQGVALQSELPQKSEDRAKLEPTDFTLHPTSRAATHDDGAPIGAPLAALDVPPLRPPTGAGSGKGKTTKPAPAKNQKPAF